MSCKYRITVPSRDPVEVFRIGVSASEGVTSLDNSEILDELQGDSWKKLVIEKDGAEATAEVDADGWAGHLGTATGYYNLGSADSGYAGLTPQGDPQDNKDSDGLVFDGNDGLYLADDLADSSDMGFWVDVILADKTSAQVIVKDGGRGAGLALGINAVGDLGLFARNTNVLTKLTIPAASWSAGVRYIIWADISRVTVFDQSSGDIVATVAGSLSPGDGGNKFSIGFSGESGVITYDAGDSEFCSNGTEIFAVGVYTASNITVPGRGDIYLPSSLLSTTDPIMLTLTADGNQPDNQNITDIGTPPVSYWDARDSVTWVQFLLVNSGLSQGWGHQLLSGVDMRWGSAAALQSGLSQYWRYSLQLQSALEELWGDAPVLQGGLLQRWRVFGAISSGVNQRWSVLQGTIQSGIIQQWDVKSTSPLSSAINQFWDSPQAGAVLASIIFYVEIGGVAIQSVTDCQAGLNINEAFNTATITIRSRAEFGAIALGHPVTIVQFGVEFKYFVAGRDSGWAVSGSGDSVSPQYTEEFVIRCESVTAALHRPHAVDLNQEWPAGGSAEQIIGDLAAVENITVDFQADDFLVPPNFLTAESNTPWEVIQRITGPLRLAEQTLPDGTLVIRESFPDLPGEWEATQPLYLLSADGGFNKYVEQFDDDQMPYNMVTVTDTLEDKVSDSLIIEHEDISSRKKRIRVWEVPWIGDFVLEHSGDDSVSITREGVVQEELTYLAEIVDGKGRVGKPCYAVSSFSFLKNNLTGVVVTESGEVTTTVNGNSLVKITYTTKYQEFIVNKGADDKLQVYINGVQA